MPNCTARNERLRGELRVLVFLEIIEVAIAISAIAAIAAAVVVLYLDTASETLIGGMLIASLAYLALAIRTNAGIRLVRRQLTPSRRDPSPIGRGHPYRSAPQS